MKTDKIVFGIVTIVASIALIFAVIMVYNKPKKSEQYMKISSEKDSNIVEQLLPGGYSGNVCLCSGAGSRACANRDELQKIE